MSPAAAPVKVFLADDSLVLRRRIRGLLDGHSTRIVGEAGTPDACIAGILATAPDVVVLDARLEGGTGLRVLEAIRPLAPRIAFVVFSHNSGPAYRQRYLGRGAACFLDKSSEFERLAGAVEAAGLAARLP